MENLDRESDDAAGGEMPVSGGRTAGDAAGRAAGGVPPFGDAGGSAGSESRPGEPLPSGGRETLRILRDDPQNAVERLRERIRSGDADYRTWHNLAIALDRSGERGYAIDAAENAVEQNPDSASTQFLLGLLLRQSDRFDEAVTALDRALEIDDQFPRLHATRGVVHFHRGDHDRARADFETALERSTTDVTSLFNLTIVHVATKDYSRAQECIERLIEIEPKRASHHYRFLVELGEVRALDETLTQAHRIKNLLSVAGDRLRRFVGEYADGLDPEGREDLKAIRDDVTTVYGDMVGLLGAIRPRQMNFGPVKLRRVIDRIGFVAMTRARGVTIDLDVDPDLPELVCDVDLIQEALLNLLLNAIDAVVDRYRDRAAKDGRVQIHARAIPEKIEVLVTDNGTGIPAGDLDRVFRLGFTTKRLGSGIGLAHTRRIIEEHGGKVSVHTTGPNGSTVRIELPIRPKPAERLVQLQHRARLLADPRELVLEEPGHDLGL